MVTFPDQIIEKTDNEQIRISQMGQQVRCVIWEKIGGKWEESGQPVVIDIRRLLEKCKEAERVQIQALKLKEKTHRLSLNGLLRKEPQLDRGYTEVSLRAQRLKKEIEQLHDDLRNSLIDAATSMMKKVVLGLV